MTATQAGDRLRVATVAIDESNRQMKANSGTVGHAESMILTFTHVRTGE